MLYVDVRDATGQRIGTVGIRNDGTGDEWTGNYEIQHWPRNMGIFGAEDVPVIGHVHGHWRDNGPWPLVRAAIWVVQAHLREDGTDIQLTMRGGGVMHGDPEPEPEEPDESQSADHDHGSEPEDPHR